MKKEKEKKKEYKKPELVRHEKLTDVVSGFNSKLPD